MRKQSVYLTSWNYLVLSKGYVFTAVALFVIAAFIGFFFSSYLGFFDALIRDLVEETQTLEGLSLILFIFQNNVLSAFFALFLGAFLGVVPLFNALMNGALVGYVVALASQEVGSLSIIWRLLPHGIFELPAIFISIGLGLRLGLGFFATYFSFYRRNRVMRWRVFLTLDAMAAGVLALILASQFVLGAPEQAFRVLPLYLFFGGAILGLFGLFGFVFFFFVKDQTLRHRQIERFSRDFWLSLYVFGFIVIPLLVAAAIIEGLLISFL